MCYNFRDNKVGRIIENISPKTFIIANLYN